MHITFPLLLVAFPFHTTCALNTKYKPVLADRSELADCSSQSASTATQQSSTVSCDTEVGQQYAGDSHQTVHKIARGSLDCAALGLSPSMQEFDVSIQGYDLTASKLSFDQFPDLDDRYSWNGELTNTRGFLHLVWDAQCKASLFQLDVTLEVIDNTQIVLTTRPCVNSTINNCLYTVVLAQQTRDEEPPMSAAHLVRRLDSHHLHDLELAHRMNRDDLHAHYTFIRDGGRKLSNNVLRMPSGRLLDDGTKIRVLYLYDTRVRDRYTDASIVSMLTAAYVTSNQALTNSGLTVRFELAAIAYVNYSDVSLTQSLNDVISGNVPQAAALREQYAADLVQLVTESSEYCGVAYLLSSADAGFANLAYSVIYSGCINNYSNIHEMGHNMGLQHDRADASPQTVWDYGYGYRYCNDGVTPQPAAGYVRSVMAYPCASSTRVPLYSGPNVNYQGTVLGDANDDNERVLQQTYITVANFRQGVGNAAPTPVPTTQPTWTSQPTTQQPAPQPTAQPTTQPTTQPTSQLTTQPVTQPTIQPTSQLTTQPAPQPTTQPVTQSTTQPTSQPNGSPTTQPTLSPTAKPHHHHNH